MTDTNGIINLRIMCLGENFICFQIRDLFTFMVQSNQGIQCLKAIITLAGLDVVWLDSHLIINPGNFKDQSVAHQYNFHRNPGCPVDTWYTEGTLNVSVCVCVFGGG